LQLEYAFRDEKLNILSLTYGKVENEFHEIFICKKENQLRENMPYVFDVKKSEPRYKLSDKGNNYQRSMINYQYKYNYIGYLYSDIIIKVSKHIFEVLNDNNYFSIWDPDSPVEYFNSTEGHLIVFRVFEIDRNIEESYLSKGRSGRNYYYRLNNQIEIDLLNPVLNSNEFKTRHENLLNILHNENALTAVNKYHIPEIIAESSSIEIDEYLKNEDSIYHELKKKSKQELERIIENQKDKGTKYLTAVSHYYRNPYISAFAKIRANGVCDLCNIKSPFFTINNDPYLETHHIIALSMGGKDSRNNVCAICPNCHRELHHGIKKEELKDILIKKFTLSS
jgi:5-methylcytosine-specific restriction endonuclease McrA